MKFSQILRDATERYLWDGYPETHSPKKQTYICFALEVWETHNPYYYRQVAQLKNKVHSKIDGYSTVKSWLQSKYGEEEVSKMTDLYFQTLRKNLVAEIITELEAKGI